MIARKIQKIQNIKVDKCTIFDVDPHGKFICIYLTQMNVIKIIKTIYLTSHFGQYSINFSKTNHYSDEQSINADCQISPSLLYKNYRVEKMHISKQFKQKQLIGVSNLFTIKVFELNKSIDKKTNQNMLSVSVYSQVRMDQDSPLLNFSFCFSALYISFYDRQFKILQLDKDKKIWTQSDDMLTMPKQFIRINVYHSASQLQLTKSTLKLTQSKTRKKNSQRNEPRKQKQVDLFTIKKGIDEVMSMCLIKMQNTSYCDIQEPKEPTFVYQKFNNTLFEGVINEQTGEPDERQICTDYQRPDTFATDQEEFRYLELNELFPARYILSKCEQYMVCIQRKEIYSVRSYEKYWQKIIIFHEYPYIHPFYSSLQTKVFYDLSLTHKFQDQFDDIIGYLRYKYEFILIAYSNSKGRKYQEEENYQLQIQLNVVHRLSRKKVPAFRPQKNKTNRRVRNITNKKRDQKQKQKEQLIRIKTSCQFETQKFCLFKIQLMKQDIKQLKWISPTQFIIQSPSQKLYYYKICQNLLEFKLLLVYEYLLNSKYYNKKSSLPAYSNRKHKN